MSRKAKIIPWRFIPGSGFAYIQEDEISLVDLWLVLARRKY